MSFSLDNKLAFIGKFQFLRFLLDSLVKNLGKNDFKHFGQEFDSEVLDLVDKKDFISMNICIVLEKFNKHCLAK